MRKLSVSHGLRKRGAVLAAFFVLTFLLALTGAEAGASPSPAVTINGEPADSGNDIFNATNLGFSVADPIGDASGGIIFKNGSSFDSPNGNKVEVTGAVPNYSVVGGAAISGEASANSVKVGGNAEVGSSSAGSVVGGVALEGDARGNEVRLEQGALVHKDVIGGGSVTNGSAEDNTVRIDGGTVGHSVWGGAADMGESTSGNAVGNQVFITGDTRIGNSVLGGGTSTGDALRNLVDIAGSLTLAGWVYGGQTAIGAAAGNNITINGSVSSVNSSPAGDLLVVGGRTGAGNAESNTVTINAGGSVDGAHTISGTTRASVIGGLVNTNGNGNASNNTVINQGTVSGGDIYGGAVLAGTGSAEYNTVRNTGQVVTPSGASGKADIIGGYVRNNGGDASYNTVYFNDGLVWDIKGGRVSGSNGGDSSYNQIVISGGRITGNVIGGDTDGTGGHADNNTVEILGGHFGTSSGTVTDISGGNGNSSAINNTVILSNQPVFENNRSITGHGVAISGGGSNGGSGDYFTGNTLKVHNYTGVSTLEKINNFQKFDFLLSSGARNGQVILQTENLILGNGTYSSAVTGLTIAGGGQALQAGDSVTLIASETTSGNLESRTLQVSQGAALNYTVETQLEGNNVTARVAGNPAVAPETKSLSEGRLSGVTLVSQGADLIAGQGMDSALKAARAGEGGEGYGLASFAAISGGRSRYNTGSHVDMSSLSLLTGLSWGSDFTPGRLTLGAFFEYGTGSYDTYNSFSNAASVHGDGDIYHIGGGVLGRMDFSNTGPGRFYGEASLRAGGVHNQYDSSDLRDSTGRKADYDSSSAYYGLHLGAGYIWNITEDVSLDLYGKYFWTRQEGDSVTLATGDPVNFQDVDSQRLRLGGRFAYAVSQHVSPYIGAAWEHEFDGEAHAETYGYAISAPSLDGDTGIGELGLTLTPSATLPLSFDLGVQGYVGKREGVTGSLQMKIEF
ncbi:MAG: autotransporter outer membrane beta-barrel domain-containing protein [Desulfarculales bacterium]|jgi:hypothetical protein|nr:autotransporter outer membrane beta-barrel domain-containing protein [Desulfarculales bacterium]